MQRRWLAASTPAELVTAVSQSASRAPSRSGSRAVSPSGSHSNLAGLALGSRDRGGQDHDDDDGGIDVEGSADRRPSFPQVRPI